MTANVTRVAAAHLGRPLLITPEAAEFWVRRIGAVDPNFTPRPSRLGALIRKFGRARAANPVLAMDDDERPAPVPFHVRGAYVPLYVGDPDDIGFCWALKDGIALMQVNTPLLDRGEDICGTIFHGYDTLLQAMREAAADERVKAIFLRAQSPGGVVAGGLGELAAWMRANRAGAGGKPIWVYADQSCSAMYWITAQADRVIAADVSMVGSIGAVIVHEDWSGFLDKQGIKVTAIQFGEGKTDGAFWAALSPRAQADLQAEIDQCGRNFVNDVAAGRPKLTAEQQIATQARVYLGRHDEAARSGLALGLVDDIMGEEAAFAALLQSVSGPGPASLPAPAAPGPSAQTQEQPMATKAEKAARLAALTTEIAGLEKDPAKNAARLAAAKAEKAKLETDPEDDQDQQSDPADPAAPEKKTPPDDGTEPEAVKIAKSPQAKSHPEMATAAIAAGMTLAQFQGQAAAAGNRLSPLATVMAHQPRLGSDLPGPSGSAADRLVARAQARAAKLTGGK